MLALGLANLAAGASVWLLITVPAAPDPFFAAVADLRARLRGEPAAA